MYKNLKIGMIFPGQGSQFVGMAKNLYDQERLIQEYFEIAANCVDQNFVKLCFASSDEELLLTKNAQTATFLVSCSFFSLLKEKYGIMPMLVAGHGFGQYSALYAAGSLNFPDGLYLLKKRSEFMEEYMSRQNGGMLAVSKITELELKKIVTFYDKPEDCVSVVELAHYNSPFDFTLTGTIPELLLIADEIKKQRGKTKMLKVAGAFHSRMMREPQNLFRLYLEKVDICQSHIELINTVNGEKVSSCEELGTSLVEQFSASVKWWDSFQQFKHCDVIIEIGPSSTLTAFVKDLF
ncbi:MAG TPA: ACP S-malonyltransferase, partial [Candidatus Babeliales bacterium]|nr:ACP S-malonyltransferase [Candidatus Babeliales bacterium]